MPPGQDDHGVTIAGAGAGAVQTANWLVSKSTDRGTGRFMRTLSFDGTRMRLWLCFLPWNVPGAISLEFARRRT